MLDNAPPSRRRKENAASVRKWHAPCAISKLANGKKPTGLFARKHLLAPYTGEAKMRITKITSASKVALRSRTQFAPYLALVVLRMTTKLVGEKAS